MSTVIRGTIAELAGKLTLNGVTLNQPELSVLTRLGRDTFAKPVAQIRTGVKGRPTTVWEINTESSLNFAIDTAFTSAFANLNTAEAAPVVEEETAEAEEQVTA